MATSNTKLDNYDKAELQRMKARNPAVTLANDEQTTIAFQLKGNTVQFAMSVKSHEEKKFRRKVGEYNALNRYENGQYAVMGKWDFVNMLENVFGLEEVAQNLADKVGE